MASEETKRILITISMNEIHTVPIFSPNISNYKTNHDNLNKRYIVHNGDNEICVDSLF